MASTVTSTTGLGLSGLSSGLDTTGIIAKLMSIESAPQTALKSRLATATTYRTALQSLNTSVAGITTGAKAAAKAGALSSFTAASDTSGVTATASSSASSGAVSFSVDRLATAQVSVSGRLSTWPDTSSAKPSITIQVGSDPSKAVAVTALSNDLDDVVAAVNGSGTGVTATKVAVGSENGVTQYRLQFRGATGDDHGFAIRQGDTTSTTDFPMSTTATASSAQITLYKGSGDAEQQVRSATNTFDELLTGVDVTVSKTTDAGKSATISIAADATAATTAAQTLTSSLTALFSGIAAASAITTGTSANGLTSTSGSIFTGDGSVRLLKDSLLTAVSGPVDGRSPSSIGIVLTKDGTIAFDQTKFASAMASDPVGTTAMFQTIAGRVATASDAASNQYTGSLTQKITAQQSTETSLTKDVSDWDTRLAAIQAQYTKQFNALETALNSLSSQSSYLTSQIAGLTTNYQNK